MSREATLEPDEEGAHLHGAELNGGLGRETGIAQRQAPPFAVELGRPELVPGEVHLLHMCDAGSGEQVLEVDRRLRGELVVLANLENVRDADEDPARRLLQGEEHPGQLTRAAVELAKAWRTDKYLRRLDAVMVVADSEQSLQITGGGDVLEPHDGIIGIGSGGSYALSAARALADVPGMDAMAIAKKSMGIAADLCIYTNHNFTVETLPKRKDDESEAGQGGDGAGDKGE